jgi:hypothetical protein
MQKITRVLEAVSETEVKPNTRTKDAPTIPITQEIKSFSSSVSGTGDRKEICISYYVTYPNSIEPSSPVSPYD